MQSEITSIEEVWHFDEKEEKKKIQNIFDNILNEYNKTYIYDVILSKYGIMDIWTYYILDSKFWENRFIQLLFVCILVLILIRLFRR